MAPWLVPALKLIGPHIGTILTAAVPAFTRKGSHNEANQTLLLQEQIAELQAAAAKNAENTRQLAAQLLNTVDALGQAAVTAAAKLQRAYLLSLGALVVSVVAVCTVFFAR